MGVGKQKSTNDAQMAEEEAKRKAIKTLSKRGRDKEMKFPSVCT